MQGCTLAGRLGRLVLSKEQRGLEGHAGSLFGGTRARRRHCPDFPLEPDLDLIEAEYRGRACGVPLGRQHRGEAIAIGLVRTAIGEKAVAARYPAICKLHVAGAFATCGAKPGSISAVSEHEKILREKTDDCC